MLYKPAMVHYLTEERESNQLEGFFTPKWTVISSYLESLKYSIVGDITDRGFYTYVKSYLQVPEIDRSIP